MHGWMRVPSAFSSDEAAAMREVVWRALAKAGILRDDPTTWTSERPTHLQHLKLDPAFRAVGSTRTIAAIDAVLEGQSWTVPKNWGAFFLLFPSRKEWGVPSDGWHLEGDYTGRLAPPCGVKVHAMFGDVEPRCGGMTILSGSHRLVHKWFAANPPPARARGADMRLSLRRHSYVRDLCTEGDRTARIARFHDRAEEVDGVPLQVLENTASAGDVILMHSLLLHAAPTAHSGVRPRFLLNQDIHL